MRQYFISLYISLLTYIYTSEIKSSLLTLILLYSTYVHFAMFVIFLFISRLSIFTTWQKKKIFLFIVLWIFFLLFLASKFEHEKLCLPSFLMFFFPTTNSFSGCFQLWRGEMDETDENSDMWGALEERIS